jgi:hypothetical protein
MPLSCSWELFVCVPDQMHGVVHAAHFTYDGVYRVFLRVSGPCPWI